jgi:hypothetical protein
MRWKRLFLLSWLLLFLYSILLSPDLDPDSFDQVISMITGDVSEVEPLVFMLFNLMGVLPFAFASILLFERNGNRVPSWPFVLGSFLAGAFSILPYMGVRDPELSDRPECGMLLRLLDSRYFGLVLKIVTIGLIAYGIGAGDWGGFFEQFRSSMFIHVMTLDFIALSVLFPFAMRDDMKRRGWESKGIFLTFALVPVLGPLTYLVTRPRLCEVKQDSPGGGSTTLISE